MTPDEVHQVRFGKPPFGKRGYDEEQVDVYLDRIEQSLRGGLQIGRDELTDVRFGKPPLGKRGYSPADVDAFLARVLADWSYFQ